MRTLSVKFQYNGMYYKMLERELGNKISILWSKMGNRIFRNNVGTGWVGKSIFIKSHRTITVNSGDVVIRNARPLKAGLCTGSSDYIGWKKITITPDMVGKVVALFTAFETKIKGYKATEQQHNFIEVVNDSGGIGVIVREEADIESAKSICER